MHLQIDDVELKRVLQGKRQTLEQFIHEEKHRSILIHSRAEGITVWLAVPSGADKSNSCSFTKKDLKCDLKSSLHPALSFAPMFLCSFALAYSWIIKLVAVVCM